jgi:hypothetical protein
MSCSYLDKIRFDEFIKCVVFSRYNIDMYKNIVRLSIMKKTMSKSLEKELKMG